MKYLKIISCKNSSYWYKDLVGQTVPYLREYEDCYVSREPDGYSNIVLLEDAIVIDESSDENSSNRK